MAAKVYDLSSYLQEEKSTIKIGEEVFQISDGFNDLLKIDALSNRKDELGTTEFVKEFLKIALGEEAGNRLLARNYSVKIYMKIMNCIQEVYGNGDDEEQEGASSNTQAELV